MTQSTGMTMPPRRLGRIALAYALAGFAATAILAGGMELKAQSFAGHNSRAPVDVNAGRIELEDRADRVSFSGGVTLTQAGLTVRSQRMLLNYSDAGTLDIQRLTASGGVTVTRGNESASGDVAIYDFSRRTITMAGNVRLRRGADNLNGERLVIDLASGISSLDGRPSASGGQGDDRGRVTGTFTVSQEQD